MLLADAFIQSDLQFIQAIQFLSVCVFPGNWTLNLLRGKRNALPLSHRDTLFYFIIDWLIVALYIHCELLKSTYLFNINK